MAYHKVFMDHFGQCIAAPGCLRHGCTDPAFHLCVDRFTYHVQDIFLGCEIFVQRTNRKSSGAGNLPGSGFVETLINKKLNGCIGYLASSAINEFRVFNLGGDIDYPVDVFHNNILKLL